MFYTGSMTGPLPPSIPTLSVKAGRWFEAHATGWGVAVLPVVLALILGAGAIALFRQ